MTTMILLVMTLCCRGWSRTENARGLQKHLTNWLELEIRTRIIKADGGSERIEYE